MKKLTKKHLVCTTKEINLKALIESSLKELAEDIKDAELYAYLVKNRPEGKEMLNADEKEAFENWFGD